MRCPKCNSQNVKPINRSTYIIGAIISLVIALIFFYPFLQVLTPDELHPIVVKNLFVFGAPMVIALVIFAFQAINAIVFKYAYRCGNCLNKFNDEPLAIADETTAEV